MGKSRRAGRFVGDTELRRSERRKVASGRARRIPGRRRDWGAILTSFERWNLAASWVAAFGTILASVVALYLARRGSRVRLQASLKMVRDTAAPQTPMLALVIANHGERPVQIVEVHVSVGRRRARRAALFKSVLRQLPKTLPHGEGATILLTDEEHSIADFATTFVTDLSERSIRSLRVRVYPSVGRPKVVSPDKPVLAVLRKLRADQPA